MEGDTPSFLGLIGNGLNVPEQPDWGGWGGRYELYTPRMRKWLAEAETRSLWSDAEDEVLGVDSLWHTSNMVPTNYFTTGSMHFILAVTDGGTPPLTRYRRVIVSVNP